MKCIKIFPAPHWYHKALCNGFSFTNTYTFSYDNGWLLQYKPATLEEILSSASGLWTLQLYTTLQLLPGFVLPAIGDEDDLLFQLITSRLGSSGNWWKVTRYRMHIRTEVIILPHSDQWVNCVHYRRLLIFTLRTCGTSCHKQQEQKQRIHLTGEKDSKNKSLLLN